MKNKKRIIILTVAAAVFLGLALFIGSVAPTTEIAWVMGILLFTVYLFVFEVVPIDVAAMSIMVFLGLTTLIAPLMGLESGLADVNQLFVGFSSNAVISIIAVMIIGHGLDKTGVMNIAAKYMMRIGGTTESRVNTLISGTVGIISGFMQNVGAAALFLPVVGRIAQRANIPVSRLLMPMGFCAILGGTLTLVGSSPLILLNDLISNSNTQLPANQQMDTFGLFAVTPVGLALIATGILYFIIFGRFVLPKGASTESGGDDKATYFQATYGLDYRIKEMRVKPGSPLIGQIFDDFETHYKVRIIAVTNQKQVRMGPSGINPNAEVLEGDVFALIGEEQALYEFAKTMEMEVAPDIVSFAEALSAEHSGLAEMVIPPTSPMVGESARELGLRAQHGVSTLAIIRSDGTRREGDDVRSIPFEAGDTVVAYADWKSLYNLHMIRNYAVVTTDYPQEEVRAHKAIKCDYFPGYCIESCTVY